MTPASLTLASFDGYPAGGRTLAQRYLGALQSIPLAVLPGFLEQIHGYDWRFPQEQAVLTAQLDWLSQLRAEARETLFLPFATILLSKELTALDWVHDPQGFSQALSAYLWQTRQIDTYRAAAIELFRVLPTAPIPAQPALVVAVMGRGAPVSSYPLFTRLRRHGLYARSVPTQEAPDALLSVLAERARSAPAPYAHWYIDGGEAWPLPMRARDWITHFTYPQLGPIKDAVLKAMDEAVQQGTGPEVLGSRLSHLSPAELNAAQTTADPRLQHLYVSLLTVGSGTQIYSTSFMQAAAIEVLRRAHPTTLYFRFAPRRRQASINDMIEARSVSPQEDPEGSLVDADMAAFYAYLELAKLPGGERASFVAWVEGRGEALVIGPHVTKDVESTTPISMRDLISFALS